MLAMTAKAVAVAMALGLLAPASARAADFKRGDYHDVTARKKLPTVGSMDPLAATSGYLDTMRFLDRDKTVIEVLVDKPNRRVFRITQVCKPVEECGDDSVRATREAIALQRAGAGWKVVWVGAQFICQKGRGQQDWSRALCR